MAQAFNINNADVVKLTNKLEKMHKSAMPLAVRGTLNDAAFLMKKYKIILHFKRTFTERQKNFIKTHTWANKSKNTFNIKEMVSEVGVLLDKSTSGNELINQEYGGIIKKRDYINTDESRVAESRTRRVGKVGRVKGKELKIYRGKSFVKKVHRAKEGGYIKHKKWIFRINSIDRKNGRLKINTTPIFTFKRGRSVRIKKRPFLKPAANDIIKIQHRIFKKNAEKRIRYYYKK